MKKYAIIAAVIVVLALIAWGASRLVNRLELVASANYLCSAGKTIRANFYMGEPKKASSADKPPVPNGLALVGLSDGRTLKLAQTLSADGARYANEDESFVFWAKGNGALVLENNAEKSYIGCIRIADVPNGVNLPQVYVNHPYGVTMRFPSLTASTTENDPNSFKVDETFVNATLGPNKAISGIKFTIPASFASGTNLSSDSYVSLEEIPQAKECSAGLFLPGAKAVSATEGRNEYSVATSSDAAAGNRYDQVVFAIPGTNPCVAMRYFVHYGAIENYPKGSVQQFDEAALLGVFDVIRRTLVVSQ